MRKGEFPFLKCESCGMKYELSEMIWRCACGAPLDVVNTPLFPLDGMAGRPRNFWRYRESFAMENIGTPVSLGEIFTPLVPVNYRGLALLFKLDYLLPTGSYKDRGIAVCMNQARMAGIEHISEDSSGNAGASVAAYSAAMGIKADIYVPAYTSKAKVDQIAVYGSTVHLVDGTRDDAAREAQSEKQNVFYVGHSWNPFFKSGVKTIAYEIAEQCGWESPDRIVTPAGGGSLVLGLIQGFNEMKQAGYVKKVPGVVAVQALNCAPIYKAFFEGSETVERIDTKYTCAEGVALDKPARGPQVLRAIRENKGIVLGVSEEEIVTAWKACAEIGFFIEPTSATALAGIWNAVNRQKIVGHEERIVVVITGNGLKTKSDIFSSVMKILENTRSEN